MALSADTPRTYHNPIGRTVAEPMQTSVTCYVGGAVSRDSGGEVGPLAGTEAFAGFCIKQATNSGAAGAEKVLVYSTGYIELPITGVDDNNDISDIVYATADDTFTLTASGGASVGKVVEWISSTTALVKFEADSERSI